jgi:hypothetical protein
MIRNPNDIVERLVADFARVLDGRLISVIMYGSAVSHEYRPGKSDVNIALVLTDTSIPVVKECLPVQKRWMRRGMAAPFYFSPDAIESLCNAFPVEFFAMRQSYRILYGDDVLAGIHLHSGELQGQCLRDLSGLAMQLKREFGRCAAAPKKLGRFLDTSLRRLIPVFRAILLLNERKVPNSKNETIAAVEDLFGFGASVFSEVNNATARQQRGKRIVEQYDLFTRTVESIIGQLGRVSGDVPVRSRAVVATT